MKLPKRFHEKPRKQDVYSKKDWERHPSHAPPYGFGSNGLCAPTPTDSTSTKTRPKFSRENGKQHGKDQKRERATAFISAFTLCPSTPTTIRSFTPLFRPALCPAAAPAPRARVCHASSLQAVMRGNVEGQRWRFEPLGDKRGTAIVVKAGEKGGDMARVEGEGEGEAPVAGKGFGGEVLRTIYTAYNVRRARGGGGTSAPMLPRATRSSGSAHSAHAGDPPMLR